MGNNRLTKKELIQNLNMISQLCKVLVLELALMDCERGWKNVKTK